MVEMKLGATGAKATVSQIAARFNLPQPHAEKCLQKALHKVRARAGGCNPRAPQRQERACPEGQQEQWRPHKQGSAHNRNQDGPHPRSPPSQAQTLGEEDAADKEDGARAAEREWIASVVETVPWTEFGTFMAGQLEALQDGLALHPPLLTSRANWRLGAPPACPKYVSAPTAPPSPSASDVASFEGFEQSEGWLNTIGLLGSPSHQDSSNDYKEQQLVPSPRNEAHPCDWCRCFRHGKAACDEGKPTCSACLKKGSSCVYSPKETWGKKKASKVNRAAGMAKELESGGNTVPDLVLKVSPKSKSGEMAVDGSARKEGAKGTSSICEQGSKKEGAKESGTSCQLFQGKDVFKKLLEMEDTLEPVCFSKYFGCLFGEDVHPRPKTKVKAESEEAPVQPFTPSSVTTMTLAADETLGSAGAEQGGKQKSTAVDTGHAAKEEPMGPVVAGQKGSLRSMQPSLMKAKGEKTPTVPLKTEQDLVANSDEKVSLKSTQPSLMMKAKGGKTSTVPLKTDQNLAANSGICRAYSTAWKWIKKEGVFTGFPPTLPTTVSPCFSERMMAKTQSWTPQRYRSEKRNDSFRYARLAPKPKRQRVVGRNGQLPEAVHGIKKRPPPQTVKTYGTKTHNFSQGWRGSLQGTPFLQEVRSASMPTIKLPDLDYRRERRVLPQVTPAKSALGANCASLTPGNLLGKYDAAKQGRALDDLFEYDHAWPDAKAHCNDKMKRARRESNGPLSIKQRKQASMEVAQIKAADEKSGAGVVALPKSPIQRVPGLGGAGKPSYLQRVEGRGAGSAAAIPASSPSPRPGHPLPSPEIPARSGAVNNPLEFLAKVAGEFSVPSPPLRPTPSPRAQAAGAAVGARRHGPPPPPSPTPSRGGAAAAFPSSSPPPTSAPHLFLPCQSPRGSGGLRVPAGGPQSVVDRPKPASLFCSPTRMAAARKAPERDGSLILTFTSPLQAPPPRFTSPSSAPGSLPARSPTASPLPSVGAPRFATPSPPCLATSPPLPSGSLLEAKGGVGLGVRSAKEATPLVQLSLASARTFLRGTALSYQVEPTMPPAGRTAQRRPTELLTGRKSRGAHPPAHQDAPHSPVFKPRKRAAKAVAPAPPQRARLVASPAVSAAAIGPRPPVSSTRHLGVPKSVPAAGSLPSTSDWKSDPTRSASRILGCSPAAASQLQPAPVGKRPPPRGLSEASANQHDPKALLARTAPGAPAAGGAALGDSASPPLVPAIPGPPAAAAPRGGAPPPAVGSADVKHKRLTIRIPVPPRSRRQPCAARAPPEPSAPKLTVAPPKDMGSKLPQASVAYLKKEETKDKSPGCKREGPAASPHRSVSHQEETKAKHEQGSASSGALALVSSARAPRPQSQQGPQPPPPLPEAPKASPRPKVLPAGAAPEPQQRGAGARRKEFPPATMTLTKPPNQEAQQTSRQQKKRRGRPRKSPLTSGAAGISNSASRTAKHKLPFFSREVAQLIGTDSGSHVPVAGPRRSLKRKASALGGQIKKKHPDPSTLLRISSSRLRLRRGRELWPVEERKLLVDFLCTKGTDFPQLMPMLPSRSLQDVHDFFHSCADRARVQVDKIPTGSTVLKDMDMTGWRQEVDKLRHFLLDNEAQDGSQSSSTMEKEKHKELGGIGQGLVRRKSLRQAGASLSSDGGGDKAAPSSTCSGYETGESVSSKASSSLESTQPSLDRTTDPSSSSSGSERSSSKPKKASRAEVSTAAHFRPEFVLRYQCQPCDAPHEYDGRLALAPFTRSHGFKFIPIPKDGDCFYHCITTALNGPPYFEQRQVSEMRRWVSTALTEDQLAFYRILAQSRRDDEWLDFARNGRNSVKNLEELKEYVLREGRRNGARDCMWADSFAHSVIAEKLSLSILFVDMERERGAWPYRLLAESGHPKRYIVVKREGPIGHFVVLSMTEGQACFPANKLPQIIRRLWKLDEQPIP